jgi:glycosyltransferase involved in cell wall biosynthesis
MLFDQFPLVTVVTLVFNTGNHITDTLDSIRNQKYPYIQHIIIDDCSSDNSVDIITKWIQTNKYECNFIKHQINKGICASINEAIGMAKGKYISFIGDDIMLPYKIAKDVVCLEKESDAAFCYSKMILSYIDKNEERGGDFYKESNNLFYDYILGKTTIAAPTVTYRRSIFEKVGLFDESLLFEDYDMFLRVTYEHKAVFINYYSVIYKINNNNYSIQYRRQIDVYNEFLKILDKKWNHLPGFWYYKNNRHQFTFCQLASRNKKEAVKHLFPALTVFWKKRLYRSLMQLLLVWK